jgi:glycosyltransferase involved in cell wall biosynthesis
VSRVCLVGLIAAGHSGVPRYAAALTQALDRVADEFPELELVLLTTPAGLERTRPRRLEAVVARGLLGRRRAGAGRVASEQILARRAEGDLLHFFDLTGPVLAPRRPFTTTVHDAALRHRSEGLGVAHKRFLQPWAARHAKAAVAVSAFAKDEAVRHFGADPARVHVVHSGPGLLPSPTPDGSAPDDAGPYLLYVGDLAEHKNLPFLVRAFGRAAVPVRLVLVGRRGERFESVRDAVDASAARERIELRGGASDEEIDALYRGASALVLPSRYEGFGFTPLEAMARGCPVLASDIPALREVSGDGALLLPLGDEDAWAGAIRRVLADDELRQDLRRRGGETVARYSWEEAARGVCRVFGTVLGSAAGPT